MSARDNVLIGDHCRSRGGFIADALNLPGVVCEERLLNPGPRVCSPEVQKHPKVIRAYLGGEW
jgi:hypothetical protein